MEYIEAELSLFTLNAEIEVGLMLKKLRDGARQLSRYLGKNASGRGKSQSRCPTVGSRIRENQCGWVKVSKR